jgi:hypothetical protein
MSTQTRVALMLALVVTATGALAVLSLRIALGTPSVAQAPATLPARPSRRVAGTTTTQPTRAESLALRLPLQAGKSLAEPR